MAVFTILHGAFDAAAPAVGSVGGLRAALEGLSAGAFLVAVFGCPPAMAIGLGGWTIMLVKERRGS